MIILALIVDNQLYSECLVGSLGGELVRRSPTELGQSAVWKTVLVDQVVVDGKPDQFRGRSPFEFFKNTDSIGTDGFDTDCELFGDLGGSVASSDQAEDFKLPIGKPFVQFPAITGRSAEVGRQLFGQRRADVAPSLENTSHSACHFFGGGVFCNVA